MVSSNKKEHDADACSLQRMHCKNQNTVTLTLNDGGRRTFSKMHWCGVTEQTKDSPGSKLLEGRTFPDDAGSDGAVLQPHLPERVLLSFLTPQSDRTRRKKDKHAI